MRCDYLILYSSQPPFWQQKSNVWCFSRNVLTRIWCVFFSFGIDFQIEYNCWHFNTKKRCWIIMAIFREHPFAFYSGFKANGTFIVNTAKQNWSCGMRATTQCELSHSKMLTMLPEASCTLLDLSCLDAGPYSTWSSQYYQTYFIWTLITLHSHPEGG